MPGAAKRISLRHTPKAEGGHTVADVEGLGLAIYYKHDGTGYLLASNQGNYTYTVYTREGDNDYLMTFKVSGSDSVDAATGPPKNVPRDDQHHQ